MKKNNPILILILILAVLCLVFGLQKQLGQKNDLDSLSIPALENLEPAAFSYENAEGSFSFTQTEDSWISSGAKGCDLRQETVKDFLATLSQLPVSRELKQPDDLADYGLATPYATVTLEQNDKQQTLSFGEQGDNIYLSVSGEETVYVLSQMPEQLDYTMLDWIDTPAMPYIKTENISSLSYKGYTLTRESTPEQTSESSNSSDSDDDAEETEEKSTWKLTQPDGSSETGEEPETLTNLLTVISNLYFEDCVDFGITESAELAPYGLDVPAETFSILYTDADTQESGSYTLSLGGAAPDGSTYVKLSDSGFVFLLSSDLTESLQADFQAFVSSFS